MNGACNGTFFLGPAPWGPGEGPKGQISLNTIKFQLLSQFQRFLNQTLCVFSQMKDIKHIRRDFHLAAWVMPQGWDLGVPWGLWGQKNYFSEIQPDLVCELLTWMAYATAPFFGSPPPGALGRGQKVKYHWIWITKSISKILKPNIVYLLKYERYIKYQTGFSFGRLGHAQGWDLGVPWGLGGQKKFFSEI